MHTYVWSHGVTLNTFCQLFSSKILWNIFKSAHDGALWLSHGFQLHGYCNSVWQFRTLSVQFNIEPLEKATTMNGMNEWNKLEMVTTNTVYIPVMAGAGAKSKAKWKIFFSRKIVYNEAISWIQIPFAHSPIRPFAIHTYLNSTFYGMTQLSVLLHMDIFWELNNFSFRNYCRRSSCRLNFYAKNPLNVLDKGKRDRMDGFS